MAKIYIFGDSIAQGVLLNAADQFQLSPNGCVDRLIRAGYPLINYGMSGYTIRQGYAAFQQKRLQPGAGCVIEYGANDCKMDWDAVSDDPEHFHDGQTPMAEFQAALERFVRDARSRGLRPILATPLPLIGGRYYAWICRGRNAEHILRYFHGDPEGISRWQGRYASAVREAARQYHCPLLDLRDWMIHEMDYPDWLCQDGVHPNEKGHGLMAERISARYPLARLDAMISSLQT